MKKFTSLLLFLSFLSAPAWAESPVPEPIAPQPVHAVALHGTPKYGPDFKHVDYVNPDAPKGGTLKLNAIGSFD